MHALLKHFGEGMGRLVLTVFAALTIGVGVPLLWVWIGSKLQSSAEGTSVSATTAAAMFVGIVFTYFLILLIGGWVQARLSGQEARPGPTRHPWNRSMRDTPYRPGEDRLSPLESAFVFTAVVISAAFMIWFFVFAGSPLPGG